MLKVDKLNKSYAGFKLKDVSFELPDGYIMGFIGMNGAGKSTTLKSLLNIVKPDSGTVEIFGKDMQQSELEIKQSVGFTLGSFEYYQKYKLGRIADSYKRFYNKWDDKTYQCLLKKFGLNENKRISELSQGMRVKFSLTLALSHNSKLFILDEPTSGLDPIARDEVLELFQELVEEGDKSILFSTHITSDLDKCADYIVFIKDGKIIANAEKDGIIYSHALICGNNNALTQSLIDRVVSYKSNAHGFRALILKNNILPEDNFESEIPTLEDIMVFYNKENM